MDAVAELPAQATIKVRLIVPGPNHRTHYDPRKMEELKAGLVAANGVRQPIQVRPHPTEDGRWEIIAGERRWRGAKEVFGDDYDMPVVVSDVSDAEARALGIIENHYRDDPSDMEQARGAAALLQFFKGDKAEVGAQLGWSVDLLERRLLLLNCSAQVQDAVVARRLKLGHAELLAGLEPALQDQVLAGVLEHGISVEALKAQLGQFSRKLADAFFDTSVCLACPHNSARQSALFDESIGDGYCQNPAHYDELTMKAVEAKAEPLRERFQTVRIVGAKDGFVPLPVRADGPLGVGEAQYADCQSCANFGCAVSAVPGSIGKVTEALCFDAACNSRKVAARRAAEKEVAQVAAPTSGKSRADTTKPLASPKSGPANELTGRVAEYRLATWRKWAANALMAHAQHNAKVLAAFAADGRLRQFPVSRYTDVSAKLDAFPKIGQTPRNALAANLARLDAARVDAVSAANRAISACVVYELATDDLQVLLNYLHVDEAQCFTLATDYLELLTVAQLEALAKELRIDKAMGSEAYARARNGKRADFIKALLAVKGFSYAGAVPKALRYTRTKARGAAGESALEAAGAPSTVESKVAPEASDAAAEAADPQDAAAD